LEKIFPNLSIRRDVMRKRNKKTTIISRMELSGLTEHILAGMGEEGKNLRERLMRFLEERTVTDQGVLKKTSPNGVVDISQG
jgi:hypothetical protein